MNESSNPKTMYEAVPAVAELNKVPGFDPLKFLRRTKDSMRLDLPYQKLWFRMAHPNGRKAVRAAQKELRVAVAQNFLPEIERVAVLKTREILEHAAHGNVARANHTESPREIRDGAAGGKLFS